jgi:hypothetical protein
LRDLYWVTEYPEVLSKRLLEQTDKNRRVSASEDPARRARVGRIL